MPIYDNVPVVEYYPSPENFIRKLYAHLTIDSVLDVGTGHGGVFDYDFLTRHPRITRRAACDIHWIRPMGPEWKTNIGVDAQKLTHHYRPASFDLVQCFETLEHVEDPAKALEQLCAVARKAVIITSADETHHEGDEQAAIEKVNKHQAYRKQPDVGVMLEMGFSVRVDNHRNRQLIAWRYL